MSSRCRRPLFVDDAMNVPAVASVGGAIAVAARVAVVHHVAVDGAIVVVAAVAVVVVAVAVVVVAVAVVVAAVDVVVVAAVARVATFVVLAENGLLEQIFSCHLLPQQQQLSTTTTTTTTTTTRTTAAIINNRKSFGLLVVGRFLQQRSCWWRFSFGWRQWRCCYCYFGHCSSQCCC